MATGTGHIFDIWQRFLTKRKKCLYYLEQISERVQVGEAVLVSEAAELPGVLLQLCRRLDD